MRLNEEESTTNLPDASFYRNPHGWETKSIWFTSRIFGWRAWSLLPDGNYVHMYVWILKLQHHQQHANLCRLFCFARLNDDVYVDSSPQQIRIWPCSCDLFNFSSARWNFVNHGRRQMLQWGSSYLHTSSSSASPLWWRPLPHVVACSHTCAKSKATTQSRGNITGSRTLPPRNGPTRWVDAQYALYITTWAHEHTYSHPIGVCFLEIYVGRSAMRDTKDIKSILFVY